MGAPFELADKYLDLGLRVLPLIEQGKRPLISKWVENASSDPNQIEHWRSRYPTANIGLAMGNGFLGLDVDYRHDGVSGFADLIKRCGTGIDDTLTAITGGGGFHKIFRVPPEFAVKNNNSGEVATGIDVRSLGGYLVGANSIHPNGNPYYWENGLYEPSEAPDALCELLLTQSQQAPTTTPHGEQIPQGQRNTALFRRGSGLRGLGFDHEFILADLTRFNAEKCTPPIPNKEIEAIALGVGRYANNAHGFRNSYIQEVMASKSLPAGVKVILFVLAEHADRETLIAYPSQPTIACETGMTERSVRTHTATAERLGWLSRSTRPRPTGGHGWLYEYQLTFPDPTN